jgi:creatinine amidohydrolase
MSNSPPWGRYGELRPADLDAVRAAAPVAYLPWGGLTWHGPHLPLGSDTIVAEAVAERCVRRTGGVLLPATSWPLAEPHPDSLGLRATTLRALLDDALAAVARGGWRVAVVVSGKSGPADDQLMITAAREAIARHGLLTLALPPLSIVDEEMLDQAALWETSVLLALRPDLANLDALGTGPLTPADSGIVGRDPRHTASASLGQTALGMAVERIVTAVGDLLQTGDPAPLHALYDQRSERYRAFVARHGADPQPAAGARARGAPRDE